MAHLLGAESLHLEYPTRIVFDRVTVGVAEGERIGIVGRNGDGKSTLLALLAGRLTPDAGQVTVRGGTRIGVLDQQDLLDESATIAEAVVGEQPEHEWAGDPRVRDVIAGLLADVPWTARIGGLSGGQRRRVSLARLLVGDWDVLMLDEPTNHLDVEAITWLARHLKARWSAASGALLVVTHDRWFLDEVCTATWEVHDRIVEPFEGGYAAYILQRVERDRQSAAIEQRRQNLARKELAWLRRGAPARTSKPKFRIDAANALIADVPEIRDRVQLQSLAVSRLGKDVVDILDVSVAYDDEVLHDVTWRIAPGERTGILGRNGAGKSTLLGLVAGTTEPTSGRVKRGKTVRVATLTQRLDELAEHETDPVRVVIGRLRTTYMLGTGSKAQELSPGQLLERLGFESAQLSTPVKDLSGGQRRRLQLLLILLDQPNVLILDEPTNDLDTDMLAALEDLLDSWPGTLIVVSHDRYFIERVTDQQYAILPGPDGAGRLRHLPGGVEEYLRIGSTAPSSRGSAPRSGSDAAPLRERAQPVPGRTLPFPERAESSPGRTLPVPERAQRDEGPLSSVPTLSGAARRDLEKELGSLDRRIAKLTERIDADRTTLADHDQSDYVGLGARMQAIAAREAELAALEERWLEVGEALDG